MADIRLYTGDFRLSAIVWCEVDTMPENVQIELTEMQCIDLLRPKVHAEGVSLLEFYRKYLLETGNTTSLVDNAKKKLHRCLAVFTCACTTSQKLNTRRASEENILIDAHLYDVLRLASYSLSPIDERLLGDKQHQQVSHLSCGGGVGGGGKVGAVSLRYTIT